MTSLHKYVDPDCLTARYGGTLECAALNGKHMADLFEFYKKEYELEYSYGYTKWSLGCDYSLYNYIDVLYILCGVV